VAQKDVYSVSAFWKVQHGFPARDSAFRRKRKQPLWSGEGKVSILIRQEKNEAYEVQTKN